MELVDGTLICLVRAKSDEEARRRLDEDLRQRRPGTAGALPELAADHLEVVAGDKGEANLGLDQQTWQRLADTVDLIVDPAALVNGVLPYRELFGPNVVGTAELIRIALTTKIKPYTYVRLPTWAARSSPRRSPRMPTSGSSAPPAQSTAVGQRLRHQQVGRRGAAARGQ